MNEKIWTLKNCNLFSMLDDDVLDRLESISRIRTFASKTPIYLPADDSNSVFLLVTGRAKICHLNSDGKQTILSFVEPGEMFGELALFAEGKRDEYVEAIERSTVLMLPQKNVTELLEQNARFVLGISKLIGFRRRRIERRLRQLLFASNRQRLTHLLVDLAEQYGVRIPDGVELSIRLSHQDIANVIGSTRETVTVELGKMQREGMIRIHRRRIVLLDTARLAHSVDRETPRLSDQPQPAVNQQQPVNIVQPRLATP